MLRYFTDWYLWYYIVLAFMGFIMYIQQKNRELAPSNRINRSENENTDFRVSWLFGIALVIPLILIAGFRDWDLASKFGDTGYYILDYRNSPGSLGEVMSKIDWDARAPGYQIFMALVKQLTNADYTGFFIIVASIQTICLLIGYRRNCEDIVICIFLFFASTDFMSWEMNGIRQFLVVAILFAIFPLVQKRRFFLFALIVLVLFTIHKSALIVIPIYIAALGKPFNKKTIIGLLAIMIALVFAGEFTNFMDDSLQGTVYKNMVSEFEGDNGTNIIRVFVYSIPAFLAIINRGKINEDTPEIIKISVNMSLFTAALYMLSIPISGVYMGRLPIYCSLFNYILLPWEIKNFFREDTRNLIKIAMVIFYLVFYVYQMTTWGL